MKKIMLIFVILFFVSPVVFAKNLIFAVDIRDWYPFTTPEVHNARGIHVDIVVKAAESLGYKVRVISYPKKRCIVSAKYGKVDGIISIAYHKELNQILEFPPDAGLNSESKWRIMQVDNVIASYSFEYDYEGDRASIPQPVRIPEGDFISYELKKMGLFIDEAKTDEQNFKKMLRDKSGSVITTSVLAERINTRPEFHGKFKIQALPIISKSYHLAFSKTSDLSIDEKMKIWNSIKKWREDYVFMLQLFARY